MKKKKDFQEWFKDWEKAIYSPAGQVLLAGTKVVQEEKANSNDSKST